MISKIERFVKKIGEYKWITIYSLSIHLVAHEKGGGRRKWSVRSKLATDKGLQYVRTHGWDLLGCIDETVEWQNKKISSLKPEQHTYEKERQ
jgi:hypothetical protein